MMGDDESFIVRDVLVFGDKFEDRVWSFAASAIGEQVRPNNRTRAMRGSS